MSKATLTQTHALFVLLLCIIASIIDFCHASPVSVLPRNRGTRRNIRSSVIETLRGGSLQSRRWERMDGKDLGGGTDTSGSESLQISLQSVSDGKACNLYVWDAPSALLHRWCQHLLKDCVYEGLGGRKFVRIEPGSILQLLYPCSRYSPDRCIACGGTFRDHLTLWWGKHLYTPFDQQMDATFASGSVLEPKFPLMAQAKRTRSASSAPGQTRGKGSSKRHSSKPMMRLFAFHRNYVTDIATLVAGTSDTKERAKKLRRELTKIQTTTGSRMEMRMLTDKNMAYVVPAALPAAEQKRNPSATMLFTRYIVLNAIDRLIGLQETENDKIRLIERTDNCC